ncbi:MAG: hypothetical protein K0S47_2034 [Herbinix sp.]|jgi:putative ABC transport system permease protein|nr:hypothetical protein [Herbinix sp.]
MIQFMLQKIRYKKWIMLYLLFGNILFIASISCITMYSDAIQQRMMISKMDDYKKEQNEYPLKLSLASSLTVVNKNRHNGEQFAKMSDLALKTEEKVGIPVRELIVSYNITAKSELETRRNGKIEALTLQLGFLSDLEQHIEIVSGRVYEASPSEDKVLDVIVSEKMLATHKLMVGEIIHIKNLKGYDGKPLQVSISGVFKNNAEADEYWVNSPSSYENMMFLPQEQFEQLFVNLNAPSYAMRGNWYLLFQYDGLNEEMIDNLIKTTREYESITSQETAYSINENYLERLNEIVTIKSKTNITLWILQAPILTLLLAFLMMISKQLLALEQTEIAVLKSRGATRPQIILLYTMQSIFIGVAASIIGIFLGAFFCQMVGSANGFMEFVGRRALKVRLLSMDVLMSCLLAIVVSAIVTVIPVNRFAKVSIVEHTQKKGRKHLAPAYQKLGLDFIILVIAIYGYYNFRGKEAELMQNVMDGKSLDPILYFSSSLFIIGAGMTALRFIHLIASMIFRLGRRFWSPALYASFLSVTRTRRQHSFIVVFIIITISLGIFDAQTARTINANDEDNVLYQVGADIILKEQWEDNSAIIAKDTTGTITLNYQEPDFMRYLKIKGVVSTTKVFHGSASMEYKNRDYDGVKLMGIDTKEFGETAWFRDQLLDSHWYHYLNAMTASSYGILVSSNFRDQLGYQLGDTLYYTVDGYQTRGFIFGFVDYWPGYIPPNEEQYSTTSYSNTKSNVRESVPSENYLIIAHRAQLQALLGVQPYWVYLKTEGSTEPVYQFLKDNDITVTDFMDTTQILTEHKNDTILQGTNGMLTVGFLNIWILCVMGFIIYWILSVRARSMQFGILRAMGMTMREIITMLINEQIFISGISVGFGILIGHIASRLYIPLIQITYAKAENPLMLQVSYNGSDTYRVLLLILAMIVLCIILLRGFISKTNVTQMVKLGDD